MQYITHKSCCQQALAAMKLGCVRDYTAHVPALNSSNLIVATTTLLSETDFSFPRKPSLSLSLSLSLLPDRTMVSIDLCKNACHSQLPFSSKTYQVSLDDRCLKQQKLFCRRNVYLGYERMVIIKI